MTIQLFIYLISMIFIYRGYYYLSNEIYNFKAQISNINILLKYIIKTQNHLVKNCGDIETTLDEIKRR
jgi:hypothetical protein